VQAAVAATYRTRPGVGAHAGEHAVWWFRNSATLTLIADNEVDPVRAEAARADAVTARRLAEGMAAAHTAQVGQPAPVPPSTAGYDAAAEAPEVVELPDVVELADVVDFDGLEVGL
jgi:hypothetical protein